MKTGTNEMISQEISSTLQLKRPLLPIDKYAAREGVSRGIIEECAKLGILQIRKCKGKTFVVDVPITTYPHAAETVAEPTTTDEIPDEAFKLTDEIVETKKTHEPTKTTTDNSFQLGLLTARAVSKRIWQVTAVVSLICLFAVFFASLWLYMDRKIKTDKLEQAYASIQQFLNDYTEAKQQVEIIRNESANSTAETKHLQNELTRAREKLETTQRYNSEQAERLNEQIRNLTAQLNEAIKNQQTLPGFGITDK